MLIKLWVLVGNELRMMLRAKATLFWIFLFPFVFLTMMLLSYGGSGKLASVVLELDDQDGSARSASYVQAVTDAFARLDGVRFELHRISQPAPVGRGALRLTLPPAFGATLGHGEPVQATLSAAGGSLGNDLAVRVLRSATLRFNAEMAGAPMLVSLDMPAAPAGASTTFSQYMLTGIVVMSIMATAMSNLCVAMADRRERNVFKLMACLPMSPGGYLLAMLLSRLVVVVFASALLLVSARYLFGIPVSLAPQRLGAALVVLLLGASSLLALGSLLSARVTAVADAVFVSNLAYIVLLFLSDLTMPLGAMPAALAQVVAWLPTSTFVATLRHVLVEGASLAAQQQALLVLLGWTLLLGALARVRFRWHRR